MRNSRYSRLRERQRARPTVKRVVLPHREALLLGYEPPFNINPQGEGRPLSCRIPSILPKNGDLYAPHGPSLSPTLVYPPWSLSLTHPGIFTMVHPRWCMQVASLHTSGWRICRVASLHTSGWWEVYACYGPPKVGYKGGLCLLWASQTVRVNVVNVLQGRPRAHECDSC